MYNKQLIFSTQCPTDTSHSNSIFPTSSKIHELNNLNTQKIPIKPTLREKLSLKSQKELSSFQLPNDPDVLDSQQTKNSGEITGEAVKSKKSPDIQNFMLSHKKELHESTAALLSKFQVTQRSLEQEAILLKRISDRVKMKGGRRQEYHANEFNLCFNEKKFVFNNTVILAKDALNSSSNGSGLLLKSKDGIDNSPSFIIKNSKSRNSILTIQSESQKSPTRVKAIPQFNQHVSAKTLIGDRIFPISKQHSLQSLNRRQALPKAKAKQINDIQRYNLEKSQAEPAISAVKFNLMALVKKEAQRNKSSNTMDCASFEDFTNESTNKNNETIMRKLPSSSQKKIDAVHKFESIFRSSSFNNTYLSKNSKNFTESTSPVKSKSRNNLTFLQTTRNASPDMKLSVFRGTANKTLTECFSLFEKSLNPRRLNTTKTIKPKREASNDSSHLSKSYMYKDAVVMSLRNRVTNFNNTLKRIHYQRQQERSDKVNSQREENDIKIQRVVHIKKIANRKQKGFSRSPSPVREDIKKNLDESIIQESGYPLPAKLEIGKGSFTITRKWNIDTII